PACRPCWPAKRSTEPVADLLENPPRNIGWRHGVDVLLDGDLNAAADLTETNAVALGACLDLVLVRLTAKHPREETGLLLFHLGPLRQIDEVQALAAIDVLDTQARLLEGSTDTGPGTIKIGIQGQHRITATVGGKIGAARRVVVT